MDNYSSFFNNDAEEAARYTYRPPPVSQLPAGSVRETPSVDTTSGGQPPQEPWWTDYNGGSPPAIPLGGGMQGWKWDGGRWSQVAEPGINTGQPPATPTGGGGGASPTGGGGVPPVPAVNVPPATLPGGVQSQFDKVPQKTPIQSAYQDALLKYMSQSQQTPSLNDPILGPQAEVYRVQQQRNQERNRRSAVERAGAMGLGSSGALDRKIQQGIQEQNFNTAAYNANLLGSELNRRRQELLSALQLAAASGDAEAARELQTRLANVSAMMQQQGLNLQGELGRGDLSLRLMQALMGNDQFYDQLGVNTALNLEGLNQRALEQIFRGGF